MTNEFIIARVTDDTANVFIGAIMGEIVEPCKIKLQGFKGEFLQGGFTNIVKAENLKGAYYCEYSEVLEGVKTSQCTGAKDKAPQKFNDYDIDEYNAFFNGAPVLVKRGENGRPQVIASYKLLVYSPKF